MEITIKVQVENHEVRLTTFQVSDPSWRERTISDLKEAIEVVDPEESGESPFEKFTEDNFKLCYVRGPWAWFTTQPVTEQWGDDWDDAPYEHNAGSPYEGDTWKIKKVAWEGPFEEPCDGLPNSNYSVKQINNRIFPWLKSDPWCEPQIKMWAGISLSKFVEIIAVTGGRVYQ